MKGVEDVLEKYYNSGKFPCTIELVTAGYSRAFSFYEAFGDWWVSEGLHLINHNTLGLADMLYRFCAAEVRVDLQELAYALKFDLCLHEKPKKQPLCLESLPMEENYVEFYKHADNLLKFWPELERREGKALARVSHIAKFGARVVLFDYTKRDYLGYASYRTLSENEY